VSGAFGNAEILRKKGWPVVPLPSGQKWPPPKGYTGADGADASWADIYAWLDDRADANIAIRLPDGVIGLDVDDYDDAGGGLSFAALEAECGPLPDAPRMTSRNDGVSGIRLYRVPAGTVLPDSLMGSFGPGVDVIQRHHRYVVAFGSVHPSGAAYGARDAQDRPISVDQWPAVDEVSELPQPHLAAIQRVAEREDGVRPAAPSELSSSAQAYFQRGIEGELAKLRAIPRANWKPGARWEHSTFVGARRIAECANSLGIDPRSYRDAFLAAAPVDSDWTTAEAASKWAHALAVAGAKNADLPADWRDGVTELDGNIFPNAVPTEAERAAGLVLAVEEEVNSWLPQDMGSVADGTMTRPEPTMGYRETGPNFIYPGREHNIASEPEAGKTWFALFVLADELKLSPPHPVLYVDFEDDALGIGGRLLDLGVPAKVLTDQSLFRYVRPDRGVRAEDLMCLLDFRPGLVVLDGITEAYGLFGLEIANNDDVPKWRHRIIRPILATGAATLATDHVTKDPMNRGRYAIGAQHKLSGANGVAFILRNVEAFGRGRKGRSRLFIAKDRPGALRQRCEPVEGSPGLSYFGDLVGDATGGTMTKIRLYPPSSRDDPLAGLKVKVSRVLAKLAGQELNTTQLREAIDGRGQDATLAAKELVASGHVASRSRGSAIYYSHLKPFETAESTDLLGRPLLDESEEAEAAVLIVDEDDDELSSRTGVSS
jgi:hypothetical protein